MITNCETYECRVYGYDSYRFQALNDASALKAMQRKFGASQCFKLTNLRTKRTIENGN